MENKHRFELSSFSLHILAMAFMLCDHLWATVVPGNDWLTCVGRFAFPIFAFMTVEGYFHTSNFKKYMTRLFIFALISEIPFNMVMGGSFFYPLHQNVLWSFIISLFLINLNEKAKGTGFSLKIILMAIITVSAASIIGIITFVDYYSAGIFMALAFYFFRGDGFINKLLLIFSMYYINFELLKGLTYEFTIPNGNTYFFPQQGFALLALIPIFLYHGKQGPYNKAIKNIYYWFYPVHLLILGIITMYFM